MVHNNQENFTYFSNDLHYIHTKFSVNKQTYEKFDISEAFNNLKF